MQKVTLAKCKTYTYCNLIFEFGNPLMQTQVVEDEVAKELLKTGLFILGDIVDKTSKEIMNIPKKKYSDIVFVLNHISSSEGYGSFGAELITKYPSFISDIRDNIDVSSSFKISMDEISEKCNIIQVCAGDLFEDYSMFNKSIGYTMFETNKLPIKPRIWKDIINKNCSLLLVPAEEVKKIFINSGVIIPIKVVNLWVHDTYKYFERPERELFKFLWAGKLDMFNRKGCLDAVEAFNEEFKKEKDVRLIIKAASLLLNNEKVEEILDNKKISLIKGILSREEFYKIFKSVDCFIFPTHGEGFGLPPLEAMATGLPTIITDWMGCSEFINEDVCYPIKVNKLEKAFYPDVYGDVGEWAAINIKEVRKIMRYVYENREEANKKGIEAAKLVNKKYRFNNFNDNLRKAIGLSKHGILEKVSIIMTIINNLGLFKQAVKSIVNNTNIDFELIIIDNGSNIEMKIFLDKLITKYTNIKVITNKENLGYAYGCNQGIKLAKYDYVCIIDADIIVAPNWLSNMMINLKKHPECGIIVPSQQKQTDMHYVKYIENTGGDIYEDVIKFEKSLKDGYEEQTTYKDGHFGLYGFCVLIRKKVFDDIGVYDWQRYFNVGVIDSDLFWRAEVKGWKLGWSKGSFVYHYGSAIKKSLNIDAEDRIRKGFVAFHARRLDDKNIFVKNDAVIGV